MTAPVKTSRARSTHTTVEVWRSADYGLDLADGGSWVTVCVEHGNNVQHQTRALAIAWASSPETWCATCQEASA